MKSSIRLKLLYATQCLHLARNHLIPFQKTFQKKKVQWRLHLYLVVIALAIANWRPWPVFGTWLPASWVAVRFTSLSDFPFILPFIAEPLLPELRNKNDKSKRNNFICDRVENAFFYGTGFTAFLVSLFDSIREWFGAAVRLVSGLFSASFRGRWFHRRRDHRRQGHVKLSAGETEKTTLQLINGPRLVDVSASTLQSFTRSSSFHSFDTISLDFVGCYSI